jgi:hypothetical protein
MRERERGEGSVEGDEGIGERGEGEQKNSDIQMLSFLLPWSFE